MRLNKNMLCELVWEFIKSEVHDVTKTINDRLAFDKGFYWKGSVMERTCEFIKDYLKETIAFRDVVCRYKHNNTIETLLYFDDSSIPTIIVVPMSGIKDTGFNPEEKVSVQREMPVTQSKVEQPKVEQAPPVQLNEVSTKNIQQDISTDIQADIQADTQVNTQVNT